MLHLRLRARGLCLPGDLLRGELQRWGLRAQIVTVQEREERGGERRQAERCGGRMSLGLGGRRVLVLLV